LGDREGKQRKNARFFDASIFDPTFKSENGKQSPELALQYLYDLPLFLFTCVKSKAQRLIARNCRFRFKLKFKVDRVQLKMVQRTIVVNQFTAAYLIEFTAEPRSCKQPLVCKQQARSKTIGHQAINDVIALAVTSAGIPVGLTRLDNGLMASH